MWTEGNTQVCERIGILQEIDSQTRKPNEMILHFGLCFSDLVGVQSVSVVFCIFPIYSVAYSVLSGLLIIRGPKQKDNGGVGEFCGFTFLINFIK